MKDTFRASMILLLILVISGCLSPATRSDDKPLSAKPTFRNADFNTLSALKRLIESEEDISLAYIQASSMSGIVSSKMSKAWQVDLADRRNSFIRSLAKMQANSYRLLDVAKCDEVYNLIVQKGESAPDETNAKVFMALTGATFVLFERHMLACDESAVAKETIKVTLLGYSKDPIAVDDITMSLRYLSDTNRFERILTYFNGPPDN